MTTRTCKVGVHGRNNEEWHDIDFQVLRDAGVEVIKPMSHTRPHHFERMRRDLPNAEIITRLYDDRVRHGHPTPAEFAAKMIPVVATLQPYCTKFHIANEPNHAERYEGWGPTDEDARSFNAWFIEVFRRLKEAHSWASIGFPGLALGEHSHRERTWLKLCRPAVEMADWLGVHCYWQTPPGQGPQLLDEALGMNFKHYHSQHPDKTLEILECGNSNIHSNFPISDEAIADEYVQWLQAVFGYPYVNSASFYILSSHDTSNWSFFSWRTEHGAIKPMAYRVGAMHRPQWIPVHMPRPEPRPEPARPVETPAGLTNQMVINAFNRASLSLGLDGWELLNRAGLDLKALARDQAARQSLYSGPKLAQLPGLSDEQRQLIRAQLPSDVSFAAVGYSGLLKEDAELLLISLAPPPQVWLRNASGALETRVARAWNRFGNLLSSIADRLGIDLGLAVAAVAAEHDPRGLAADQRLVLRFEPHLFYQRWGQQNPALFAAHFQFDPTRPWQGHRWRAAATKPWREVHDDQASEWAAFEQARSLDLMAACEAAALGFAGLLGASHAAAGYQSAAQMLEAFASSERFQVLARFDLLAGPSGDSRQIDALRAGDLESYATLAAGPSQAARLAALWRSAAAAFQRATL
jgi:hypothetical protein